MKRFNEVETRIIDIACEKLSIDPLTFKNKKTILLRAENGEFDEVNSYLEAKKLFLKARETSNTKTAINYACKAIDIYPECFESYLLIEQLDADYFSCEMKENIINKFIDYINRRKITKEEMDSYFDRTTEIQIFISLALEFGDDAYRNEDFDGAIRYYEEIVNNDTIDVYLEFLPRYIMSLLVKEEYEKVEYFLINSFLFSLPEIDLQLCSFYYFILTHNRKEANKMIRKIFRFNPCLVGFIYQIFDNEKYKEYAQKDSPLYDKKFDEAFLTYFIAFGAIREFEDKLEWYFTEKSPLEKVLFIGPENLPLFFPFLIKESVNIKDIQDAIRISGADLSVEEVREKLEKFKKNKILLNYQDIYYLTCFGRAVFEGNTNFMKDKINSELGNIFEDNESSDPSEEDDKDEEDDVFVDLNHFIS